MSVFQKLSDVSELTVGYVGTMGKEYTDTGIIFLRSLNIKPFSFDLSDVKYIPESFHDKLRKSELHTNDVVIVRTGLPGTCAVVPPELDGCNCADLVIVRPNMELIDPYFLCAFINSWGRAQVSNVKVGAVQKHFNVTSAAEMLIPALDIQTQRMIACILQNLNVKIENNNAICSDLEAMTKLLYDYWFVQFDFPDENGRPYKSSGGKMVWNEELKREIPEGWEVKPLSEVFDITMGSSPAGDSLNDTGEGIEFYQGSTDFGTFYPTVRIYTTAPIRYAKAQDVLVSVRAPVGDMNIAMNDCCIGRGLAAIHHTSTLFAWFTMKTFKPYFNVHNNNGTTFGALTSDSLKGQLMIVPTKYILQAFSKKVESIGEELRMISKENQQLASLRDFLLPMLMNGQVKVGK